MESFFYFIKSLIKNTTLIGGAVFSIFVVSIFALFRIKISEGVNRLCERFFKYSIPAFFIVYILAGIVYLFYPNFLNHIEPTVASLGLAMKKGESLYPVPAGSYPYNGVLYSPALFEIQMVFQYLGLPILIGSKLPGLIAFIISSFILINLTNDWLTRGYLLYLFPFGIMLFWNRAESFFLLIVSLTLLFGKLFEHKRYLPVMLGILGGISSALKMQGIAYVFAAFLAVNSKSLSFSYLSLFFISSILSFFIFFIPQQVSFNGFWEYLSLAGGKHGFSLMLWLENIIYLVFLILPFFIFRKNFKLKELIKLNILLFVMTVFCITIVASKHGTGYYHLLPLIPINAFILQKIKNNKNNSISLIKVLYSTLVTVIFITILTDFILPMVKSWKHFDSAQKEVVDFERKYPGLMMGVTDDNGYPYVFLRVLLKNRQIDYCSFMDLQISGIKDDVLVEKLKDCKICCLLIPNTGKPFTLSNYYTLKPLFSNEVREIFTKKYFLTEKGEKYSVYKCLDKNK